MSILTLLLNEAKIKAIELYNDPTISFVNDKTSWADCLIQYDANFMLYFNAGPGQAYTHAVALFDIED